MHTWTAVYVEARDGRVLGYSEELYNVTAEAATIDECEQRLTVALKFALIANRRRTAAIFAGLRPLGTTWIDEEP